MTTDGAVKKPNVATREAWLERRIDLLKAARELTRHSDEVARQRQQLPWVRIDKRYRFQTDEGSASLAGLLQGRSQLLVYHFMFGPGFKAGCLSCSAVADALQWLLHPPRPSRRDALGGIACAAREIASVQADCSKRARRSGYSSTTPVTISRSDT